MNPVDWVILGILAVSVLFGLYRGFIASVASMGGSLLSLGLSFWLSPMVADFLRNNTSLSNTLMSYADAATRLKDSALSALNVQGLTTDTISCCRTTWSSRCTKQRISSRLSDPM